MVPNLLLLVEPEIVVRITHDATGDDKFGIMTTIDFQW